MSGRVDPGAAFSEHVRLLVIELCAPDPVVALTAAGIVPWRARQIVEGRGRAMSAAELYALADITGVTASELVRRAEDARAGAR